VDIRVRMVIVGLIVGVVFAIVVAVQGCGTHHPDKRNIPRSAR
jgi:hypothetical protein